MWDFFVFWEDWSGLFTFSSSGFFASVSPNHTEAWFNLRNHTIKRRKQMLSKSLTCCALKIWDFLKKKSEFHFSIKTWKENSGSGLWAIASKVYAAAIYSISAKVHNWRWWIQSPIWVKKKMEKLIDSHIHTVAILATIDYVVFFLNSLYLRS